LVVIPVVLDPVSNALVRLELSSEIDVYCEAFAPVFSELTSRLTYASAALLGVAALHPINSS
jgi:hypothetical protein